MKLITSVVLAGIMIMVGCKKEATKPELPVVVKKLPVVVTLTATGVTSDSAVLCGEVITENNSAVTDRGLCWSRLPDAGLEDSVVHCSKGQGPFNAILSSLKDDEKYFYRAFATNDAGTSFGEEKSFITPDIMVPFTGRLVSKSECINLASNREILVADTLSCAAYSFDEDSHIMHITHFNAGFNCCDTTMSCEITMSNDTIFIKEVEGIGYCYCLCLFDIEIEITGLNAQNYQITFIEPYCGQNAPLTFPVDLSSGPTGTACVARYSGLWGIGTTSSSSY